MKRFLFLLVGLTIPVPVFAGVDITSYGWSCNGFLYCGSSDVVVLLNNNLIAGVSAFSVALAVVVFFYGAIRMVISQGDEGKEAGKKALIYASLGLAAALLTGGVIQFVCGYLFYLGGASAGCPW